MKATARQIWRKSSSLMEARMNRQLGMPTTLLQAVTWTVRYRKMWIHPWYQRNVFWNRNRCQNQSSNPESWARRNIAQMDHGLRKGARYHSHLSKVTCHQQTPVCCGWSNNIDTFPFQIHRVPYWPYKGADERNYRSMGRQLYGAAYGANFKRSMMFIHWLLFIQWILNVLLTVDNFILRYLKT